MNTTSTRKHLSKKIFTVLALGTATLAAQADLPGYLTDQYGAVVKSSSGECLHTSAWSPDLAMAECDADRMPKHMAAGPMDPDSEQAVKVPPATASSIESASIVQPVTLPTGTEKIILAEDALFEYDKSIIKPSGKATLDNIVSGLAGKEEVIISTDLSGPSNGGVNSHSNFGGPSYDPDLALRRTAALKTYLVTSGGIDSNRIYIQEKSDQGAASTSTTAPDPGTERVEIELVPALQ